MSDNESIESQGPQGLSELDMLKARAKMMGIEHSNNISAETLSAKIQAKLDGKQDSEPEKTDALNPLEQGANAVNGVVPDKERPVTLREYLHAENMRLIRVKITNLDPKKKDLPGEIITVANEYIGTVRKFIPFGEHTEDGWHVPYCIYQFLKDRKFLNIRTTRDRRTGTEQTSTNYVPEFSIEVMEPLSKHELNQLAQAQIAAGSVPA